MSEESVKVAVRVRPFNDREKDRKAKLIIEMNGNSTFIIDPRSSIDEKKQFSFDYSYWSHDGFVELSSGKLEASDSSSNYASQQKVFDELGRDVLKNAFEGFNCSLFAYGQTGSGKSYSMIGYGVNRGIVPIACDQLFQKIEKQRSATLRFEVAVSMMEVYNEQVRDLLTRDNPKGGLTVRQHPTSGCFYPHGLRIVPVGSYADIERRINEGTENRTIAATNMNTTSSRAHTIVTIHFDQIIKNDLENTKKTSVINLVDLAGSERIATTGVTGDRLKESTNINRSLSTLGNVISALVDISSGVKRKIVVPYRDSVLTKLLQNALGGNSKTIMIAALSPADVNYDETLSTLRFADRVKRIKNVAIVNENPMDKLIRELKEENHRLKLLIDTGNYNFDLDVKPGMSVQDIELARKQMEEEIQSQIQDNQKLLLDSSISWDDKLKNAQLENKPRTASIKSNQQVPYLANLNEDPLLSYVISYYLKTDKITIGSRDCMIYLNGISILEYHAVINRTLTDEYELTPAEPSAQIKINGFYINGATVLNHKDRILFGANHLYVFLNPNKEKDSSGNVRTSITWEFAQKEIAKVKGYSFGSNLSIEQEVIQEKILTLLPLLSEVNAISEELNKYRVFELVLMPISTWDGVPMKGTKVMIRMRNLINQNFWYWDDMKFFNRSYIIKEHYQKFLDGGEDILYIAKEDDPFWEPAEDVLIGSANAFVQSLAYLLDFDDEIAIVDHKGLEHGRLTLNISPCLSNGQILTEEHFIDQPEELLNKPYYFKVTINYIEITDERFNKGLRIRHRVFNETEFSETNIICRNAVCSRIKQTRMVTVNNVDEDWLDFFENGSIIFQIFAVQEETKPSAKLYRMTTRDMKIMEQKQDDTSLPPANHTNTSLPGDSKLKAELTLLHKKYIRLEQKEKRIQQLCREWDDKNDYAKFYKLVTAVVSSTGTKLKPTNNVDKEDSTIEIYLFGDEEKEYLDDIEQKDTNKQNQWDDYYARMVNQQRRVSLSYRVSMRRSIAPKRSHRTDSDALSVIHEGNELTNQSRTSTANDGRSRADTQSSGLLWKKTTKSDHSNRSNDSPTLFFNDKRSAACTIQ
ncbi:unnamed protein product [Adineta ricciae]|uniref:Kinesin-like protein 6 n=1 Tax=Adineta ricciae TaxID=249248 RepID=A0A813YWN1_ADIRI|nr:unnamed protein product [Adineta ricciae]CAF1369156.1 unnamed protein product [Adineta ricciae]